MPKSLLGASNRNEIFAELDAERAAHAETLEQLKIERFQHNCALVEVQGLQNQITQITQELEQARMQLDDYQDSQERWEAVRKAADKLANLLNQATGFVELMRQTESIPSWVAG